MHGITVLKSIEKYDVMADRWELMNLALPRPLAKLGTCLLSDTSVLIVGGMLSKAKNYSPSALVWEFSLASHEF